MEDGEIELLQKRVEQVVGLIERLKEENANLKSQIVKMQDEIQHLKEEANDLKEEREEVKSKVDTAISMLDQVDLEEELEKKDTPSEDDSVEN